MAVKLERNFIGIDISKEYFLIAQKRIKDAQAQPLLFEARGE
jgi:DNA modification methylase